MADIAITLKQGEIKPVYATLTAASGTLTIQDGGTVTAKTRAGQTAGGILLSPVTGYDTDAGASVRAWFLLDTTTVPAGPIWLTFTLQAVGSDTLARTYEPQILVWVTDPTQYFPTGGDVINLLSSAGLTVPATADVGTAVSAALLSIQNQTNRTFEAAETQRRYSGMGADYLPIDPCTAISAVELLDAAGDSVYVYPDSDLQQLPLNETVKTGLKRTPYLLYPPPHFPFGVGNIRVSATFGDVLTEDLYQAVVEQAALSLAPSILRNATGGVQSYKEGDTSVQYNVQLQQSILDGWRSHIRQVCGNTHRWGL